MLKQAVQINANCSVLFVVFSKLVHNHHLSHRLEVVFKSRLRYLQFLHKHRVLVPLDLPLE